VQKARDLLGAVAIAWPLAVAACGSASDDTTNGVGSSGSEDGGSHSSGSDSASGSSSGRSSGSGGMPGVAPGSGEDGGPAGDASELGPSAESSAGGSEGGGGVSDAPARLDGGDAATAGDAATGEGGTSACAGGHALEPADASGNGATPVSGYGTVEFSASTKTQILELQTTLTVPPKPNPSGTLFLWPGLQPLPGGQNYNPIGNGVLQPVLTWGGTCAPTAPNDYSSWWISAQYVNTYGSASGYTGCQGGTGIDVNVGDPLDIVMSLKGTVWSQVIVDRTSGKTATFDIDMKGQAQDWAIFSIEEPTSTRPVSDVVFTSTTITFASADPTACQPSVRGQTDYFSTPMASSDGTKCCVSRIILRAQGVAATTPDGP